MEYCIGIIDELEDEQQKIRFTIKRNKPLDTTLQFVNYPIEGPSNTLLSMLERIILQDITNKKISGLIVDYRIARPGDAVVEGSQLFSQIQKRVPQFPVVMLTDRDKDCENEEYIDVDKVYRKRDFYKIDDAYSKEKVAAFVKNMQKYIQKRSELEAMLATAQAAYESEQAGLDEILKIEDELSYFVPSTMAEVEKALDTNKLKEVLTLLTEIEDAQ